MTVVEHAADRSIGGRTLPVDSPPPLVVAAVRELLGELTGRQLPHSAALSLPGGLCELATSAGVPSAIPYQLAGLVLDLPLAQAGDPWDVLGLASWVPEALEKLRVVPLHFDGVALHYATPDVPSPMLNEAVVDLFGVRAARPLLCTPESIGTWCLPGDPSRRPPRPLLQNALTGSAAWIAGLRRLPLPDTLVRPTTAAVGIAGSTAVVVGNPRATELLSDVVTRLTGLPVAYAEVPPDVHAWLAEATETLPTPAPTELLEQVRALPTQHRGLGWHAALSGLTGNQRVRMAAWALGAPWLSTEVAALVSVHWPDEAADLLTDPDWAVLPSIDGDAVPVMRRAVLVGSAPTIAQSDPHQDAYAEALLSALLAEVLPADVASAAMSRVQAGAGLDEALDEVAPDLSASELLAEYAGLPVVDLDPQPRTKNGVDALGRSYSTADWDDPIDMDWHAVLAEPDVVPVCHDADGTLVVAVPDPLSPGLPQRLEDLSAEPIRVCVASRDQIRRARTRLLGRCSREAGAARAGLSTAQRERARLHSAQWNVSPAQAALDLGLVAETTSPAESLAPDRVVRRVEDSAHRLLTPDQKIVLSGSVLALGSAATFAPWHALTAVTVLAMTALLAAGGFRLWEAVRVRRDRTPVGAHAPKVRGEPPVVTVLVPLEGSEEDLPALVKSLSTLDYPSDRLDVLLLVGSADARTRGALAASRLPDFMTVVDVPRSDVAGRYKAANVGLLHARGRYVVLHDPGARPRPGLLRLAVRTFDGAAPEVVCLQGQLRHRNTAPGPLARLFSAGYAMTFGALPALCSGRQPIPLGPTSAFFVTDWLRTAGGWDPHNRTAQADLGIRISRLGAQVAPLAGVTEHPVESELRGWVRRSARCLAGYVQTYLVHMRRPRQLLAELGFRRFVGFQCAVAGTALAFVAFPILWSLVIAWGLGAGWVARLFPGPAPVGIGLLALNTALFVLAQRLVRPAPEDGGWRLLFSPWYWSVRASTQMRAKNCRGEGA